MPEVQGGPGIREHEEGARAYLPQCKLKYRVEDDIPIMLIDEAEKL